MTSWDERISPFTVYENGPDVGNRDNRIIEAERRLGRGSEEFDLQWNVQWDVHCEINSLITIVNRDWVHPDFLV